MFRFAHQNRVFWPVELASRGPDGEPVKAVAYIGYQLLTREELNKLDGERLKLVDVGNMKFADYVAEGRKIEQAHARLLRTHVHGWRDIVDNDDVPIAFAPEVLDAMLEDPLLFGALLRGLFEASRGAREKNLLPGHDGTPAPAQNTTAAGYGMSKTDGATSPATTAQAHVGV